MKFNLDKNSKKVLIACKVHAILIEELELSGFCCVIDEEITRSKALLLVTDCIGIITSTKLIIDKELIDAAPMLKWIGRMGSGMEIVDTVYTSTKGINCFSSPEGNCNAVGEHALGMLLSLSKHIAWSNAEMIKGIWQREQNRGFELEGKTIGIIGFGHTGKAFAKKLTGFDVKILAYDTVFDENEYPGIKICNTLSIIYEQADIVSFHVPLQTDTHYYFNNSFCNKMKKPFILINTSRGMVVETKALYNGLKSGKIIGACLDVFEKEPLFSKTDNLPIYFNEMLAMPQVVVTPHIAGYSIEAVYKMSSVLINKILCK